jgi:hypothetical protein
MARQLCADALLKQAAAGLRYALSPSAFAEELCGVIPDPWQRRVLDSNTKRLLLVCSRQSGKSTVCAIAAAHEAIYTPGSLILMIAKNQSQSSEIFAKARHFISRVPGMPSKLPTDGATALRLPSGSRIIALPGDDPNSVRGYSAVSAVYADEAAFCADGIFTSLLPALAVSNGRLALMTTPNGKRGFVYEVVSNAYTEWHIELIKAAQCPRVTAEFIAEYTHLRGPYAARSEFNCEFLEADGQYFSDDAITAALSTDLQRLSLVF